MGEVTAVFLYLRHRVLLTGLARTWFPILRMLVFRYHVLLLTTVRKHRIAT